MQREHLPGDASRSLVQHLRSSHRAARRRGAARRHAPELLHGWAGSVVGGGRDLAVISSLTLLPALLLIGGRRAFWPFVPHAGDLGADRRMAGGGGWATASPEASRDLERESRRPPDPCGRSGDVLHRPHHGGLVPRRSRGRARAAVDLTVFPAGSNAPTVVIVPDEARVAPSRELRRAAGVAQVSSRTEQGPPGTKLSVTSKPTPLGHGVRCDRSAPHRGEAGWRHQRHGRRTDRRGTRPPRRIRPRQQLLVPLILRGARDPDRPPPRLVAPALLVAQWSCPTWPHWEQLRHLHQALRVRRHRSVLPSARLPLPGRARCRLQHLPDRPRPRGGAAPRHP